MGVDRCLVLKIRIWSFRATTFYFGSWHLATRFAWWRRRVQKCRAKASWVEERSQAAKRASTICLVFCGWQGAVCRIRRRWLERRCRWLENAQLEAEHHPASARRSSARNSAVATADRD